MVGNGICDNPATLDEIIAKLREVDRLYLDQFNPGPIFNLMRFEATGHLAELYSILQDRRVLILGSLGGSKSYDAKGPTDISVPDGFPGAVKDRWGLHVHRVPDVRAYFRWATIWGAQQLERYEKLCQQANDEFDMLQDGGKSAIEEAMKVLAEEAPIRTYKQNMDANLYEALIAQRKEGR